VSPLLPTILSRHVPRPKALAERGVSLWSYYLDIASFLGADRTFVAAHQGIVQHLAGLSALHTLAELPGWGKTVRQPVDGYEIVVPMEGLFDVTAETARLNKELGKIDADLRSLRTKLDNPNFVERAKPEVVEESRTKVAELQARRERVEHTLAELRG
jgi:valyl-tRNA synthetase